MKFNFTYFGNRYRCKHLYRVIRFVHQAELTVKLTYHVLHLAFSKFQIDIVNASHTAKLIQLTGVFFLFMKFY
ncbi:hypothetical protein OUZ56_010145 [Daphnia magna]|uniref:Uncharacterized protein n=1 Tax=Daphnia magna TaxID=35525 RepID=A0ABR0AHW9_9CRUS|nr:hypothetical protein OUZ56_010145 [Daphnia magna]